MSSCEIEIKSLLGSAERAEVLRRKLKEVDPRTELVSQHKQLNHYFEGGTVEDIYEALASKLDVGDKEKFRDIIEKGKDFSVRTRLIDDEKLIFVVKASLDEGSSHNTVSRLEFEANIKGMTIDELDQLILDAGFTYQAKWSREREEYASSGLTVCLDKNAGYGYLAEFEKVITNESELDVARKEIEDFMNSLDIEELPQDRLERMFAFYNQNWPNYYGTDNIFTVH